MSEERFDVLETEKVATKIAIVGFAPNWETAPFENDDFEIWGLNELYKYFQKKKGAVADRWFEIHSRESPSKNTEEHIGFLKQCPIPVYMQEHYPDIPNSKPYPLEEVIEFVYSMSRCQRRWLDFMPSMRRLRISAANIGPNLSHQNRTVSWPISTPRSCRRSSTLRGESGKRTYIITARRMISGLVLKYLKGLGFVMA